MKKWAYYNEFDLRAAEWLKELIKQGLIMDGEVDTRSIKDVRADDLHGFIRVGFFAGIGGWDYALQLAKWPEDQEVWHGSCPCQSFSSAGKQKGFDDERDLWPVFFNLIKECRPPKVFGEQVANAIKHGWLDRVYDDMEGIGYSCGSAVLGVFSVGAPHKRSRLYWGCVSVPDSKSKRYERGADTTEPTGGAGVEYDCPDNRMAENSTSGGCRERCNGSNTGNNRKIQATGLCPCGDNSVADTINNEHAENSRGNGEKNRISEINREAVRSGEPGGASGSSNTNMDEPESFGLQKSGKEPACSFEASSGNDNTTAVNGIEPGLQVHSWYGDNRDEPGRDVEDETRPVTETSISNLPALDAWSDFALVLCRDTDKDGNHKVRRVPAESVLFSVADGVYEGMDISRADRAFPLCQSSSFKKGEIATLLKGYGNAIVPQVAAKFIKSFEGAK